MKKIALVLIFLFACLFSQNASAYTWIDRGWTDPISLPKTLNGVSYNDYAWFNAGSGWSTILFYNADNDAGCTPFHNLYLGGGSWSNFGIYGSCHWFRTDCNPTFSHCTSDDYSYGSNQTNGPVWGGSFLGFTHSTKDVMKSKADLGDYTPYGISDQVYQAKDRNSAVKLTINVTPLEGGNVTGSGISCNVNTSSICQYSLQSGSQVALTANANCGWAFGSWDNGTTVIDNPYTFNMPSGSQTLYAKFFKTFRNTVGSFRKNITDNGGWCTDYVNYETDLSLTGNAYEWWQKAISARYATGSTPRISSIVVFNQVPGTGLEYGHVGIVTAINGNNVTIRDSNWCYPYCYSVQEHTIDISNYNILGYIYYTP